MPEKSAVIHDEISQQALTMQLKRNVKDKIISLLSNAPQELEIVFDVLKHVDTQKNGSAQQSDEGRILGGFLESNEFGLGGGQPLRLQEQIVQIAVAATPAQQRFDVPIHRLHHAQRYLDPAVVQDSLQVIQQHPRQLLHGFEPLPAQLVDPALQVAQHGSLIGVAPQPVQAFF